METYQFDEVIGEVDVPVFVLVIVEGVRVADLLIAPHGHRHQEDAGRFLRRVPHRPQARWNQG